MTFRVTVFIERIQTQYLDVASFNSIKEANDWVDQDWETRKTDSEFISYGGYEIEEQNWKHVGTYHPSNTPILVGP